MIQLNSLCVCVAGTNYLTLSLANFRRLLVTYLSFLCRSAMTTQRQGAILCPYTTLHGLFLAYDFFRFVSWPLEANDKSCLHLPCFSRQFDFALRFPYRRGW
jgi:hypothetical protein